MSRAMFDLSPTRFGFIRKIEQHASRRRPDLPVTSSTTTKLGRMDFVAWFARTSGPGDRIEAPLIEDDAVFNHDRRRRRWSQALHYMQERLGGVTLGTATIDGRFYLVNKGAKP